MSVFLFYRALHNRLHTRSSPPNSRARATNKTEMYSLAAHRRHSEALASPPCFSTIFSTKRLLAWKFQSIAIRVFPGTFSIRNGLLYFTACAASTPILLNHRWLMLTTSPRLSAHRPAPACRGVLCTTLLGCWFCRGVCCLSGFYRAEHHSHDRVEVNRACAGDDEDVHPSRAVPVHPACEPESTALFGTSY